MTLKVKVVTQMNLVFNVSQTAEDSGMVSMEDLIGKSILQNERRCFVAAMIW